MDFTRHQDDLALARFRDAGGFTSDRLSDVALRSLHGPGALVGASVLERVDLSESDLTGGSLDGSTFASTNLRAVRLGGGSAHRIELYFCELNEGDFSGLVGRRLRVHGCQAMNVRFDRSDLSVVRFEETPLIRASFANALLVRVVFADSRMGGTALDRANFSGAHLVDCSFRAANLRGASFRNALLVGCDFSEAMLEGASFRGATIVGGALPAGLDTSPDSGVEF